MTGIKLTEITHPDEKTVQYKFDYASSLKKYFKQNTFRIRYSQPIEGVPEHILSIPFLVNVTPIAWVNSADVVVPTVDERFVQSLADVKQTFASMYPEISWSGEIRGEDRSSEGGEKTNTLLMFSSGVDSFDSYSRHREDVDSILTILDQNADLEPATEPTANDETKAIIDEFADGEDLKTVYVWTNKKKVINRDPLNRQYSHYMVGGWTGGVQHGIGNVGYVAPITDTAAIGTVIEAASHTADFPHPWASHPEIEGNLTWDGTEVVHDGWEYTRQEKMQNIAAYISEGHQPFIHSCTESATENCGRCEKCFRTAVGLSLEGLDPRRFGYKIGEQQFREITAAFQNGEVPIAAANKQFFWKDIQEHVQHGLDFYCLAVAEFLTWLESADLEQLGRESQKNKYPNVYAYHLDRMVKEHLPPEIHQRIRDVGRAVLT